MSEAYIFDSICTPPQSSKETLQYINQYGRHFAPTEKLIEMADMGVED